MWKKSAGAVGSGLQKTASLCVSTALATVNMVEAISRSTDGEFSLWCSQTAAKPVCMLIVEAPPAWKDRKYCWVRLGLLLPATWHCLPVFLVMFKIRRSGWFGSSNSDVYTLAVGCLVPELVFVAQTGLKTKNQSYFRCLQRLFVI